MIVSSRLARFLLALSFLFGMLPAWADVELRVEARPIADPIQAFVTVTDTVTGDPITGLTSGSFSVAVDNGNVPLQPGDVTPPPSEDPNLRVSVVFAMDFTSSVTDVALDDMRAAVKTFIDEMQAGDYAAVIKFNGNQGVVVVQSFLEIDDGANDATLKAKVDEDFEFIQGSGSNIFDAVVGAVGEFAAPPVPLPDGPKAVIVITDGEDTDSAATLAAAVDAANGEDTPVFAVGVAGPDADILTQLSDDTGGQYIPAPDSQSIADAYASIQFLLSNDYLITFDSAINDCAPHTLSVTVNPHGSDEATFTRRDCDTEPDAFEFENQTGLDTGVTARSDEVTITGIEDPGLAPVSIDIGSYSIGCGDSSTFTSADGVIANGETICVRHTTSSQASTTRTSTLTIGGVAATFSSTTAGGGGGGGGGGATGLVELLLGLGLLLARRLRAA